MIDHPYALFLNEIERPGRYLGGEFGCSLPKKNSEVKIALAFPDAYEIGMSHIGLSVLYEIVNKMQIASAERAYMPWPDLEAKLRKHSIPLVSLETATPLRDFDVIGFSLQFELGYTNLLAMLDLSQIALRSEARKPDDPIILVGGPIACHCEPLAPFVDLCLVGDGEEALPELLENMAQKKRQGLNRADIIEHLNGLPSIFAPALLKRRRDDKSLRIVVEADKPAAKRAIVSKLGDHTAGLGPVSSVKAVFDRYSVEVARGCSAGCRFCQAGFLYRPVRERDEAEVSQSVGKALECLGFDEVSLAALSTADHSRIGPILKTLDSGYKTNPISFSVPSLRAYGLDSELVKILSKDRATNVTLAPEAGSQRLRDVINKNITEADLMDAAARFFSAGITKIKLYFMLGLPEETDEDLKEIAELSVRLRDLGRRILNRKKPTVTVSVSTFIPKPFTPFQWERMNSFEEILAKHELLKKLCAEKRLELRLHDPWSSVIEAILCRGDSSIAPALERAFYLGARFDSWTEMLKRDVWSNFFQELDLASQLAEVQEDVPLPWDHVDVGINTEFLKKERRRAKISKITEPCGRFVSAETGKEKTICHACGIDCSTGSLPVREKRLPKQSTNVVSRENNSKSAPKPNSTENENTIRTRLYYSMWGKQAFLGHLDTMRHIIYSLRRAGIRLSYTKGFHPKPKIESAPALALGVIGLCEPLDIYLLESLNADEILKSLKDKVPDGLAFVGAEILKQGQKSLSKQITAAEYVAFVDIPLNTVSMGIEKIQNADELFVERSQKGMNKKINIKSFINKVSIINAEARDFRLPQCPGRISIQFELQMPASGGARPREVLELISKSAAKDHWIVRTKLILTQ